MKKLGFCLMLAIATLVAAMPDTADGRCRRGGRRGGGCCHGGGDCGQVYGHHGHCGDTGFHGPYTGGAHDGGYYSYYPTQNINNGSIFVQVPYQDAEIWIDGTRMNSRGMSRTYLLPQLNANGNHSYQFKVRWMDGDRPVEQTRTVNVRPGQRTNINFTTQKQE